jgi:hypothetical protein
MDIEIIGKNIISFYTEFLGFFPSYIGNFINFLILVLLVVFYSLIVWKFYKFISERDFLGLNLSKYNRIQRDFFNRLFSGVLFFVEYLIISPILIFVMFGIFTLFLIILTQNQNTSQILIISAVIIATIRMTAYYKKDLSQDIAKLLPLTLLGIIVLNPNSFSQSQYLERIITQIVEIPSYLGDIFNYLLFILFIEVILRFFNFIFSLFQLEEEFENEEP